MNTIVVRKLKQQGIEISLLAFHWLIFLTNQQTKVFGAKLQSKETGGFKQVRIGNRINQLTMSSAISA